MNINKNPFWEAITALPLELQTLVFTFLPGKTLDLLSKTDEFKELILKNPELNKKIEIRNLKTKALANQMPYERCKGLTNFTETMLHYQIPNQ